MMPKADLGLITGKQPRVHRSVDERPTLTAADASRRREVPRCHRGPLAQALVGVIGPVRRLEPGLFAKLRPRRGQPNLGGDPHVAVAISKDNDPDTGSTLEIEASQGLLFPRHAPAYRRRGRLANVDPPSPGLDGTRVPSEPAGRL